MFYLKKFIIRTEDNRVSELELCSGVNILYGPSNTGKSLVAELVDYMFGGDGEKLSDNQIRFKSVTLILDVDGEPLTLMREIGSNDVNVSGNIDSIDNGIYKTGNTKKNLNMLWLNLMGIGEEAKIIAKLDYSTQRLTLRTFLHMFIIKESRMVSENSILKSGDGYTKNIPVPAIMTLLYFATGMNYIEGHTPADNKIKEAKNDAIKKFVDRSLQKLADVRVSDINTDVPEESPIEIQKKIDAILSDIAITEKDIDEAVRLSRTLTEQLFDIDNQITEAKMLKNRYRSLKSQYEADVKRLTFIAEGDIHKEGLPKIVKCPFCEGDLKKDKEQSCIDAAIAEVESITLQIEDLRAADTQIDIEILQLNGKKADITVERKHIQQKISADLEPKVAELRKILINYTAALGKAKTDELLDKFESTLNIEMKDSVEEIVTDEKFDIRGKIKNTFSDQFDASLLRILREVNYEGISSAVFDIDKCDVKVNGVGKQSQGQGYRAFLNTVMALTVQEYLQVANCYQPGFLVIDSPVLSLSERRKKVDGPASDTMKTGLFKYIVENSSHRQTIIIENEIPSGVDYSNVNLILFTKEDGVGRYGLISDYKN